MDSKLLTIRSKKVGICIKDARLKARKSVEETAQFLGIPESNYLSIEEGSSAPSFPQLESLSHLFHAPFDSLTNWQAKESGNTPIDPTLAKKLSSLRDHVIAATVAKSRLEEGFTLQALSEGTGISIDDLSAYEKAERPIPFPLLGELCQVLGMDLPSLHSSQFGHPQKSAEVPAKRLEPDFGDLPAELVDFIKQPINRPYLELAQRLSQMNAEKLRDIAESLLEITY